jgi:hypothetical protein
MCRSVSVASTLRRITPGYGVSIGDMIAGGIARGAGAEGTWGRSLPPFKMMAQHKRTTRFRDLFMGIAGTSRAVSVFYSDRFDEQSSMPAEVEDAQTEHIRQKR